MKKLLRISGFVLSSLVYFPAMGHTCTLNVEGIVSNEVTPGELGRIKQIKIRISKHARSTDKSSWSVNGVPLIVVYEISIPKIPVASPTVFSRPVAFPGDCPTIVRVNVGGLDEASFSFDGSPLAGSAEVNTKKIIGNDVEVRMIPPTF
jgi:hypothetical protein